MTTTTTVTDQAVTLPEAVLSLIPAFSHFDSQALLNHAKSSLAPAIFNHSLRVFLLATRILQTQSEPGTIEFTNPAQIPRQYTIKPDLLFAASVFHDMGTHSSCNGPQRFEIEGGDAAVRYLRSVDFTDGDSLHQIWCAIALHTSAGIAERIDPLTRLVRIAVKADFAPTVRDSLGLQDFAALIETHLPRLSIEECLAEAVVSQATRGELEQGLYMAEGNGKWIDSPKFPKASWPGVLLRGHLEKVKEEGEGWTGPNPAF